MRQLFLGLLKTSNGSQVQQDSIIRKNRSKLSITRGFVTEGNLNRVFLLQMETLSWRTF